MLANSEAMIVFDSDILFSVQVLALADMRQWNYHIQIKNEQ